MGRLHIGSTLGSSQSSSVIKLVCLNRKRIYRQTHKTSRKTILTIKAIWKWAIFYNKLGNFSLRSYSEKSFIKLGLNGL